MGRLILLLRRRCSLIIFFISSTSAPKNKSKRRALFSECGAYERLLWCGWVWGWDGEKITVYSLQKTRLHHCFRYTNPLLGDIVALFSHVECVQPQLWKKKWRYHRGTHDLLYITVKHVKNGINQDLKNCQAVSETEDFDPIVKLKGQLQFKVVYFTHNCQCKVLVHCL